MTIVEFLAARLDEDERAALGRDDEAPIHTVGCFYYSHSITPQVWTADCCDCGPEVQARAIADVEVKRRIVEMTPVVRGLQDPTAEAQHMLVLAHLASVYAGHEDYFVGWKP